MSYSRMRKAPDKDDDMVFAVGFVDEENNLTMITRGPYSKVGAARGQVTQANRYKRKDTKGSNRLVATRVDWVVVE